MLLEVSLFGALIPSLLLYFVAAVALFALVDWLLMRLDLYRFTWHPPLARFGAFLCVFSVLVLST
jgi:protein AaeX